MKNKIIKYKNRIISISLLIIVALIGIISANSINSNDKVVYNQVNENTFIKNKSSKNIIEDYDYNKSDKQVIVDGDVVSVENGNITRFDNKTLITFNNTKDAQNYVKNNKNASWNGTIEVQSIDNNKTQDISLGTSNYSKLYDYLKEDARSSTTTTVAILDSGLTINDSNRDLLEDRIIPSGMNFSATYVEDEGIYYDDNGHGTSMASIIAKDTDYNVKLLPIKVIDSSGKGTLLSLYQGIEYAIKQNVDIINISLSTTSTHTELIEEAIQDATDKGIIVVVAAGNYGTNVKYYTPAKLDNVITVASVNEDLQHSDFSNYGDAIDYATFGEEVDYIDNKGNGVGAGTSFSAAKLTAIISTLKEHAPNRTITDIKDILNDYVIPSELDKKYVGNGIISLTIPLNQQGNPIVDDKKSILDYDNWKSLDSNLLDNILSNSTYYEKTIFVKNLSKSEIKYLIDKTTVLDKTKIDDMLNTDLDEINTEYTAYKCISATYGNAQADGGGNRAVLINVGDIVYLIKTHDGPNNWAMSKTNSNDVQGWYPSSCFQEYNPTPSYALDVNRVINGTTYATDKGHEGCTFTLSGSTDVVRKDFYGSFTQGTRGTIYIHDTEKGYCYTKWNYDFTINGNTEVKPTWYQKSLKINYYDNLNGDGTPASQIVNYTDGTRKFGYNKDGKLIWGTAGSDSVTYGFGGWFKKGYRLAGWTDKKNSSTVIYSTYSGISDDWINDKVPTSVNTSVGQSTTGTVNLYAIWEPMNKNICFKANGGAWTNSREDNINLTYKSFDDLTLDTSIGNGSYYLSKPGYKLLGWADYSGDSDTTIYPLYKTQVWRPNLSNIKRVAFTQTADKVEILVYANGVTTVKAPTWTNANGQDDLKWYTLSSGSWSKNGENYNYRVEINLGNHRDGYTYYYTHIYTYNSSGSTVQTFSMNGQGWAPMISSNNGYYKVPTVSTQLTAIWEKKGTEQYFIGDKNSTVTVSYKPFNYSVKKNEAITKPQDFTTSDGTKYYFHGYYYGNTQLIDAYGNFTQEGLNFTRFNSDNSNDVKAKWTNEPYKPTTNTISYLGNGGIGSVPTQTITYNYGENSKSVTISKNANPGFTYKGHTFKGYWNTKANGSGTTYYPGQSFTMNKNTSLVLYAQWNDTPAPSETGKYKFEFYKQNTDLTTYTKANETQVYDMNYNEYGQGWYVPYEKYAQYYTGFSLNANKSNFTTRNSKYYSSISANTTTIIRVYFDRIKYKVTITKDAGITSTSGAGDYYFGLPVTITASAAKGYTFKNWNNNSNMTNPTYSFTMPPTNVSYVASSNHTVYSLTVISKNKATNGTEINATWNGNNNTQAFNMYYGDTKDIPNPIPDKAGYEFTYWTKSDVNSNGTTATDSISKLQGTKYTQGLCNTTLTANFKPSNRNYKINVYYENADDDGYTKEVSTTIGSATDTTININSNTYLKVGFTFKECRDVNNKVISLSQIVKADNSTTFNLYYTRNRLTVTYNANGGTVNNQPYHNTTQNKYYIISNNIIQSSNTTNNYSNVTTVIKYGQSNEDILNPYDTNVSRRGYSFETSNVWKADNGLCLSATKYQNTNTVSNINNLIMSNNASVTVKLQWQAQVYHVILDNQMDEQEDIINKGTSDLYEWYDNGWYLDTDVTQKTTKITIPKWKGRTFLGYYTGKNGTGTKFTDEQGNIVVNNNLIADDNTTVYANWSRNKYTFDVNVILDDIRYNTGVDDIKFNVYRAQYNTNDFKLVASNVSDYCTTWYYKDKLRVDMISSTKYTYKPTSKTWTIGDGNVDAVMYAVTKPIIHRVTTVQVNDNDFTVYAYVTSPGVIASVKFPAWTNEAGQDDICSPWYEGTKGNWTVNGQTYNYAYTIQSSNHIRTGKDEHNWYNIHAYAYDKFDGYNVIGTTFNFRYTMKFNYNKPSNATPIMNGSSEASRIIIYKNKCGTDNGTSKALPTPSMRGWTFNGWYTAAAGGTQITNDSIYSWKTGVTLYAHWTPNVYTITLDNNGADYVGTTTIYEKYDTGFYFDSACTKVVSKIDKPKKIGNTYLRYYLPQDLKDKSGTKNSTIINKDLTMAVKNNYFAENTTIKAEWKANVYKIVYHGNRNTSGNTPEQNFTWNTSTVLNTNGFVRTGWNYVNWNTKPNGSGYTWNQNNVLDNNFFYKMYSKDVLMSEANITVDLYARWTDVVAPEIAKVSIEQETLLSEVTKGKITLTSDKGYDGDLNTNITVNVNEANTSSTAKLDGSGINHVYAYIYDKANIKTSRIYELTNVSNVTNTKYDFYYDGKYKPYSATYKMSANLYEDFKGAADLGIYIYAIDWQGNSSLSTEIANKLHNNPDTIPQTDVPQDKPVNKDKPKDTIFHEVNACIYTTYLTADGTNNFFAGELGIASVWTYGYVEHIDLDYKNINAEMEREITENELSIDNRMNRSYDIPNGINIRSIAWIQPVRIPPYVLQHLSVVDNTRVHEDGTTAYKDLENVDYSAIGTKKGTKTDAYNIYNIEDAEYQNVHYRSGV